VLVNRQRGFYESSVFFPIAAAITDYQTLDVVSSDSRAIELSPGIPQRNFTDPEAIQLKLAQ